GRRRGRDHLPQEHAAAIDVVAPDPRGAIRRRIPAHVHLRAARRVRRDARGNGRRNIVERGGRGGRGRRGRGRRGRRPRRRARARGGRRRTRGRRHTHGQRARRAVARVVDRRDRVRIHRRRDQPHIRGRGRGREDLLQEEPAAVDVVTAQA